MFNEFSGFTEDRPIFNVLITGDPEQLAVSDKTGHSALLDRLLALLKERDDVVPLPDFQGAITYEDDWFALPHPVDVGLVWQGRNVRIGEPRPGEVLALLACHRLVEHEAYSHLLVFVVDAAHGLTLHTREQLRYIAVSGYDDVLIFVENAHSVTPDVLSLATQEIEEALSDDGLHAFLLLDKGGQEGAAALWDEIMARAADEVPAAPAPHPAPSSEAVELSGILYLSRSRTKQHIGDNTAIKLSDGAHTVHARVALEGRDVLEKGETGRATLTLNSPILVRRGQRLSVELIDFPPRRDSICFFRVEQIEQ